MHIDAGQNISVHDDQCEFRIYALRFGTDVNRFIFAAIPDGLDGHAQVKVRDLVKIVVD
jgi:hypothetical protein